MLVTLEGLDGSGKTTVWEVLQETYPDAVFTREPTETWYGQTVRRALDDEDSHPLADLFLFTADHAQHLQDTIRPALEAGSLVFSDRYSDSRYAYQGATLSGELTRPMEYVRGIHQPFTRKPDLTLYLDIDPETAIARSGRTDKLEDESYLQDVRANYERLLDAEPERFQRIDATQSPEAVLDDVEAALERFLDR